MVSTSTPKIKPTTALMATVIAQLNVSAYMSEPTAGKDKYPNNIPISPAGIIHPNRSTPAANAHAASPATGTQTFERSLLATRTTYNPNSPASVKQVNRCNRDWRLRCMAKVQLSVGTSAAWSVLGSTETASLGAILTIADKGTLFQIIANDRCTSPPLSLLRASARASRGLRSVIA